MKIHLILFLTILCTVAKSTEPKDVETLIIEENFLNTLPIEDTPTINQIKLSFESALLNKNLMKENFQTNLNIQGVYGENKSRQLNQFVPVTSPIKNLNASITSGSKFGLQSELKFFTEQFTNNFLRRSTTTGAEINFLIDLYKDFLGRSTKKRLNVLSHEVEAAKINQEINAQQFKLNLQKLYWSLVANEESIKLTKSLIKQAQKQVAITSKKYKSSVSDQGVLARTKSLLASRKGSLNSLEYARSNILKTLREFIPSLGDKKITLGSYDINKITKKVLRCTDLISSLIDAPLELTKYDDLSKLYAEILKNEIKLARIHDDIDVKVSLQAQLNGRDFSYSDSVDNLSNDPKPVGNIIFSLSMPMTGEKTKTKNSYQRIAKLKGESLTTLNTAKVIAFHKEIGQSIKVLLSALDNQKLNTESLKTSIKNSRLKFSQARLPIEQLVQEEDAYFLSEISSIQTNLSIVHTLLDYFSVFTKFNCPLNI